MTPDDLTSTLISWAGATLRHPDNPVATKVSSDIEVQMHRLAGFFAGDPQATVAPPLMDLMARRWPDGDVQTVVAAVLDPAKDIPDQPTLATERQAGYRLTREGWRLSCRVGDPDVVATANGLQNQLGLRKPGLPALYRLTSWLLGDTTQVSSPANRQPDRQLLNDGMISQIVQAAQRVADARGVQLRRP